MAVQEQAPRRAARDWSFLAKLIGAAALAAIAQGLFVFQRGGITIGAFALLLLVVAFCSSRPCGATARRAPRWLRPPSSRSSSPPIRGPSPSSFTGRC